MLMNTAATTDTPTRFPPDNSQTTVKFHNISQLSWQEITPNQAHMYNTSDTLS